MRSETVSVSSSLFLVDCCPLSLRFVDSGEMPESFPYKSKALFAFEDIDGADVCFFGMHVQEYSSDCPHPNQRYGISFLLNRNDIAALIHLTEVPMFFLILCQNNFEY